MGWRRGAGWRPPGVAAGWRRPSRALDARRPNHPPYAGAPCRTAWLGRHAGAALPQTSSIVTIDRQKIAEAAQRHASKGQFDAAIAEYQRIVAVEPGTCARC